MWGESQILTRVTKFIKMGWGWGGGMILHIFMGSIKECYRFTHGGPGGGGAFNTDYLNGPSEQ